MGPWTTIACVLVFSGYMLAILPITPLTGPIEYVHLGSTARIWQSCSFLEF